MVPYFYCLPSKDYALESKFDVTTLLFAFGSGHCCCNHLRHYDNVAAASASIWALRCSRRHKKIVDFEILVHLQYSHVPSCGRLSGDGDARIGSGAYSVATYFAATWAGTQKSIRQVRCRKRLQITNNVRKSARAFKRLA